MSKDDHNQTIVEGNHDGGAEKAGKNDHAGKDRDDRKKRAEDNAGPIVEENRE